ncbi:hypothetical protein RND61_29655 [Streptomyces sp. TRM76323]|uniref:Uncharacterized protein n=1 Tax=Streptomyces tamarix TaxID=3078565 RepID=A0ABU3QUF8_9ACTN|nr:hypothetical protein [Streptomyces tamarix]MDT9686201.1 hypothetical protein [Streptomyces tamarix]
MAVRAVRRAVQPGRHDAGHAGAPPRPARCAAPAVAGPPATAARVRSAAARVRPAAAALHKDTAQ